MYEMVTGQPPFSGDTPFAVAVQRLQRPAGIAALASSPISTATGKR